MKNITKHIESLHAELLANKGIVPDSWKPYIHLIEALLSIAKLFTNDKVDAIIDEILAAIKLLENA